MRQKEGVEGERGNKGWRKKEADRQTWGEGDRERNNFSSLGRERVGWVTSRYDTYT